MAEYLCSNTRQSSYGFNFMIGMRYRTMLITCRTKSDQIFHNKKLWCILLIVVVTVLETLSLFGVKAVKPAVAYSSILFFCCAFNGMNAEFKKMSVIFLIIGGILGAYARPPLDVWINGAASLANITAILVVMQLFTIPVQLGDYSSSLSYAISNIFRSERGLYAFISVIIHLLGSFLLFGTIPVTLSLFGKAVRDKVPSSYKDFLCAAMSRSYGMVVLWAPGAVNVVLVMNAVGVTWTELFPLGALVAFGGLLLSIISWKESGGSIDASRSCIGNADTDTDINKKKTAYRKVLNIVFAVIILTLLIIGFDMLGVGSSALQIILAGAVVSVGWTALYRASPALQSALHEYAFVWLGKSVDLAALYVAIGFFSAMLEAAGIFGFVFDFAAGWAGSLGIWIIPITSGLMFTLSCVGMHPFVLIIMIGGILASLPLSVAPVCIAIAISLGASVSYMASPFAGIVLTTSKFLEIPVKYVSVKCNGVFCLCYFVLGNAVIMLWQLAH